jgi:hypothetical protein
MAGTYTVTLRKSDASKGGIASAKSMTAAERSARAAKAAKARWQKEKKKS